MADIAKMIEEIKTLTLVEISVVGITKPDNKAIAIALTKKITFFWTVFSWRLWRNFTNNGFIKLKIIGIVATKTKNNTPIIFKSTEVSIKITVIIAITQQTTIVL